MKKIPRYIYILLGLIIIFSTLFFVYIQLCNKNIFVMPDFITEIANKTQSNNQIKKEENEKQIELEQAMDNISKWGDLTQEEKDIFQTFENFELYLKNPDSYVKPPIFPNVEDSIPKISDTSKKDKSNGNTKLDLNLTLIPIDGQYKIGGIYYNNNEDEIPIVSGEYSDYSISFKQRNEKFYTINTFSYDEKTESVKQNYNGSFETIADNVERAIVDNSYVYIISTPNGAFSVVAPVQDDVSYYDDLVINRIKRSF